LAPAITVNSVAPGVIEFSDDHTPLVERLIERTPMRKHGTGEDVAEAVAYFLSCSDYVTGQLLAIDGGLSLGGA
jgi:NAD(P)-dependent dehydrogenase (short-subunit alcohol dehydrogenase family)